MQYVKISELELWDKNPRFITNENFEKLKKSITDDPKFLEKRPILVNKVDGKMIVYGGNQRLKAMQDLGREEAPVDIEENIDENLMIERAFKDNMEYGKFDNKIISDDFDKELLLSFDLPSDELNIDDIFGSNDRGVDFDDYGQSKDDYNFDDNPIKEIKLNYSNEEFVEATAILDEYMEKYELSSFSDTVLYILRQWKQSN